MHADRIRQLRDEGEDTSLGARGAGRECAWAGGARTSRSSSGRCATSVSREGFVEHHHIQVAVVQPAQNGARKPSLMDRRTSGSSHLNARVSGTVITCARLGGSPIYHARPASSRTAAQSSLRPFPWWRMPCHAPAAPGLPRLRVARARCATAGSGADPPPKQTHLAGSRQAGQCR